MKVARPTRDIAISSPWFSMTPVEELAPAIFKEFSCWEIVAEHKHHLSVTGPYLREYLSSHDVELQVHAPLSDINISSFSEKVREASVADVIDTVRMAAGLGAKVVTFHPGHLSPVAQLDPKRVVRLTKEAVRRIARAGSEHGIPLAMENMPKMRMMTFPGPDELLECIDGTEVGVCLDIGHAHTTGTVEAFLPLAARFRNIHIHDNNGVWDEHLVLATGSAPLERIASALKDTYRHAWVIEAQNLDEGVQSRDVLRKLLD